MLGAGLAAAVALVAACAGTVELDGAGASVVAAAAGDAGGSVDGDGLVATVAAGDAGGTAEDSVPAGGGAGGSVDGAGDPAVVDGSGGSGEGAGEEVVAAGDAGGSAEVAGGDAGGSPEVEVAVEDFEGHLLTGLRADVGPGGVVLMWTVDEERAGRITGFSCHYRTPGHIRFGVSGAVECGAGFDAPGARSAVVAGLPEYGDYDFEVVAKVDSFEPAIYWGERALRLRVAVTEDLAGPPGPGLAVSGDGPVVSGCGPGDGPGLTSPQRPWRLDEIVSDTHLTHYPGRGWSAGGDPATAPDWPDLRPMSELLDEAGLDGYALGRAAAGTGTDQQAAATEMLAGERGAAVVAYISARTKALLRPGPAGGWELRLHSSFPFGADYVYEPAHAVAGWGDPAHAVAWPALYERTDCPPPSQPDATHDVALALAGLEHSGYGWWAVEPVGAFPERIVATKGGLSFGDPADIVPDGPAVWRGRATGHLFWDRQRFAFAGDVTLTLERPGGGAGLAGRIDNVVVAPLHHDTLQARPGPPAPWRALTLDPAADPATGGDRDGAWSGAVRIAIAAPDGTPAAVAADAFEGDWQAAAHGPAAAEIAGRLRIWTPPDGADPSTGWPAQAVLVAGFGASRTS